ncbi:hypothetical protein IL306_008448 [Fusarium sp. DS 682]|nr:hypothetical protein IL306_008448 [Fusarium sp. DS 682]
MEHFHQHVSQNRRQGVNGDGEKVYYVIPSELDNYWTGRRVDAMLNSQQPSVSQNSDMIINRFPRIFSILAHIGQPQWISWFCASVKDLDDRRLPFDETCFPPRCKWADDFLQEQWMFIPLILTQDKIFGRVLDAKTILPVTYQKQLTEGHSRRDKPTLWEVRVHPGGNLVTPESEPVVFKVYESAGAENLYKAENDAYLKLHAKNNKHITKYLGFLSFKGKKKSIIVMEYAAGGSLHDFLHHTPPPISPHEFRLLWTRLLKLLDGLQALHDLYRPDGAPNWFLAGVHQDIQPANILVFPGNDKGSRFDVRFKLKGFGLAEIGRFSTSSGTMATKNRRNRMYMSPESFANVSVQDTIQTGLPPSADIWALGAVFSDVLVWSIHGEIGREQYRLRRRAEIAPQRHLKKSDHDACFHDGSDRLRAVEEFHNLALQDKRGSDNISSYMSNIILDYMLTGAHERLNAMQIRLGAERKIKNINNGPPDGILAVSGEQLALDRPNPMSSVLEVGTELGASPRTSREHSPVGTSPARFADQVTTASPLIREQSGGQKMNSLPVARKVTVDEVYQMMKTDKPTFPSRFVMRSDKSKEIMKLPGMVEARMKIDTTRERDQIMLIDNFRSMEHHKPKVVKTARVISYVTKVADDNGIELYAASETPRQPQICKTSFQIERAITRMKTVDGTCDMRRCLDYVLERVFDGKEVKPTNIYIFTDGVWEPGEAQVEFVIKRAIDFLAKRGQPPSTLMFQFIQFGHDPVGHSRLQYLDGDDIVDIKHCDDHVPDLVIGRISSYADESYGPSTTTASETLQPPLSEVTSLTHPSSAQNTITYEAPSFSVSEASDPLWSNVAGSTHPSSVPNQLQSRDQETRTRRIFTFPNYNTLVSEDETENTQDDIRSVSSADTDIGSLAESESSLTRIHHAAVTFVVNMLTADSQLASLYKEATKITNESKFIENHRKLLKKYYLELRKENQDSQEPSQVSAIQIFKFRYLRILISREIWSLVSLFDSNQQESILPLEEQGMDQRIMLDRFLCDNESASLDLIAPSLQEDNDSASDESEFEDFNESENILPHLEAAKQFFISGQSFQSYRGLLQQFLRPMPASTGPGNGPSPLDTTAPRQQTDVMLSLSEQSTEAAKTDKTICMELFTAEGTSPDTKPQLLSPNQVPLCIDQIAPESACEPTADTTFGSQYGRVLKFFSHIGLREKEIPPGHRRIRWKDVFPYLYLFQIAIVPSNY